MAGVSPADRANTGLIVAFSAGCLAYSRRFFEGIIKQGQKTASPALFPETVFNSPVSHVATVLGLNGAAYALVGDEAAWVAAIKTASIWLKRERVKQVLILGAEEFDPLVLDAYRSARWLRRRNSAQRFLTSEGAAGILVRSVNEDASSAVISTAHDGLIYRSKNEAIIAAEKLIRKNESKLPVYQSAQNNWLRTVETQVTGSSVITGRGAPYFGEAFTASAGWNTIRALSLVDANPSGIFLPIWGLNHQFASLELKK